MIRSPSPPRVVDFVVEADLCERRALTTIAEGKLLRFLAGLNKREIFPCPVFVQELGTGVVLVPWRRRGWVTVNHAFTTVGSGQIWRNGRRTLLLHVGDWSAAVMTLRPGDTIEIPSLIQKQWLVLHSGIAPIRE